MQLGWNEVKQRAIQFSREWAGETREDAEAKSFWDAFFNVFGIPRRSVATFEEPVRKLGGQYGFIDLFWKGRLKQDGECVTVHAKLEARHSEIECALRYSSEGE